MDIEVTSQVMDALLAEAGGAHPHECCGILAGGDGLIDAVKPARNVHPAPATHFEIDPQALVDAHRRARAGGPSIAGYYHSHPTGSAKPSATDRAMAPGDGRIWAIIADGDVQFWRDDPDGFVRVTARVIPA